MLHVTLSSTAAERLWAALLPGDVVVWGEDARDRLTAEGDEIVLWFGEKAEAQQAMLEVVVARPPGVPVSFVCTEPDLEKASTSRLNWLFHHRPTAGAAFFRLCGIAHEAMRSGLEAVNSVLPQLNALPLVQKALSAS